MNCKIISCLLFLFILNVVKGQSIKMLDSSRTESFRGLSVVSNKVVWVSGSAGTVGRSIDAGETWEWLKVKGFETIDFRDIEAFDDKTAVIMGVGAPAYILRTTDGGKNWQTVYENKDSLMFLDAMEFWNINSGIVLGDPIDGRIFIARTFDGGKTWQPLPFQYRPLAAKGEACFASSGSNIVKLTKKEAIFVTGGLESNVFIRDKKIKLPIIQGTESTGANAIAVKNKKTFMVVGGDFNKKNDNTLNAFITHDAGVNFKAPATGPDGYRSSVLYAGKNTWMTTGLNGVDISIYDAQHFKKISNESFHVIKKAKKGKAVFLSGGRGHIGKLVTE